ncbi:hypothetical protein HDU96_006176 [Phlyctochytrium bullatum]|nr:hypothetical protein HDU96_006176 [Phlyctochytrium bullatum]
MEPPEKARQRFMRELEFVQCLANPKYLQYLAQNQYFEDKAFLNYLKYLLYWREPKYAKFIVYPYCLEMLLYLQYKAFREAVAAESTVTFIHQKEFYLWSNWRAKHPGPFPEDEDQELALLLQRKLSKGEPPNIPDNMDIAPNNGSTSGQEN